jgi:hypothetical protein
MMVNRILTVLLISVALFMNGCARIASFRDDSTGADIIRLTGNKLTGHGIARVELNVQQYGKKGTFTYSLIVVHAGPQYLDIPEGPSLVVEIDGIRKGISGRGSERHRVFVTPFLVEETAYYHDIDPGLIQSIASAKQVRIEVHGSQGVVRRDFSKINFNKFKEFLDKCSGKSSGYPA